MNSFYQFFYHAAEFFRSLAAVMIFLICLVAFQVFETQTLFFKILGAIENEHKRFLASLFLSIAYEVAQLIFTVNKDHVHKGAPLVISMFSLVIHAWFFEVWEGDVLAICLKSFASVLLSYLTYMYCHLFLEKWEEANQKQALADLEQTISEKKQSLSQTERELSKVEQQNSSLKQINQQIKAKIEQLTCPHCGKVSHTQGAHNAHVGQCKHKKKELVPI